MKNVLIVVDMQKDFVNGALGTPEAQAIVPAVETYLQNAASDTEILFTRDTHSEDYPTTREGRHLPVPHCIRDTDGWQIIPELLPYAEKAQIIDKPTFGSVALMEKLTKENEACPINNITLIGLCTDICVISNAMLLKAAMPETDITVVEACCAGVTPESHRNALESMKMCQIEVV
ncbi:MAG: cysteine hydrolase [Ruminococcaceae bacterium]|nr:cysteine hydrolase [Oscillospiraceae bacterium]